MHKASKGGNFPPYVSEELYDARIYGFNIKMKEAQKKSVLACEYSISFIHS